MAVDLIWKHQQETYSKMDQQLKKTHRAAHTYPTGAGKTFPSLKYIEDALKENPRKRILILAPLVEILNQDRDYIKKYILQNSDLKPEEVFTNLIFSTYANLNNRYMEYLKQDIIVADEFHRIGAEEWQKAFDTLLERNPNADFIAMTATPDRTDGRNMIEEYFTEEEQVYELTLSDALSGDKTGEVVLNPSRYVRVLSELRPALNAYKEKLDELSDGEEKNKLLKRYKKLEETINAADSLKDTFTKAMKKKDGKYIVFCKDEVDLKEAMEKAPEWFAGVNEDIYMDYVFSGGKDSRNEKNTKAK